MPESKLPPRYLPPLTTPELKALFRQNPTPELKRVLWEMWRMKQGMVTIKNDYLALTKMWPPNSGGRPVLLETLKSRILHEVNESWPQPKEIEPAPVLKQPVVTPAKSAEARERLRSNMAAVAPGGHLVRVQKFVLGEDDVPENRFSSSRKILK